MKTIGFILLCGIALAACQNMKYQPDNVFEEIAEEAVKAGAKASLNVDLPDIDFSVGSPEHGFSPKSISPFKKEDPASSK